MGCKAHMSRWTATSSGWPWSSSCLQVVLLLLAVAHRSAQTASAQPYTFKFRTGVVISDTGDCSGAYEMNTGFTYFLKALSDKSAALRITDKAGNKHSIAMGYVRLEDNCDADTHSQRIAELLASPYSAQFVYGSGPTFATAESQQVNTAGRLLYHCCVGADSIYDMGLKHVFGIQTSNSKYTFQALKAAALTGEVKNIMIAYRSDHLFTSTTCRAAVEYVALLKELRPQLTLTQTVQYTANESSSNPHFWTNLADQAEQAQVDMMLLCENKNQGNSFTQVVMERSKRFKALLITVSPTSADFISRFGNGAEYVLSAVQWHPAMLYTDSFFGTAAHYTSSFTSYAGYQPSYVAAGASATAYTLALAISEAFNSCDISRTNGSSDALLFDPAAISCTENNVPFNISGYELVHEALAQLDMQTFFGPVAFSRNRRNVAKQPGTTQVLGQKIECVLPLDAANKALVLPAPSEMDDGLSNLPFEPWVLAIVVVVAVLAAVLLGILAYWLLTRQARKTNAVKDLFNVPYKELVVVLDPVITSETDFEVGRAMYRGAHVSLKPVLELPRSLIGLDGSKSNNQSGSARYVNNQRAFSREFARTSVTSGARDHHSTAGPGTTLGQNGLMHGLRLSNSGTVASLGGPSWLSTKFGPSVNERERLSRLVAALSRLQHPNIVPIIGVCWDYEGIEVPLLVSEYEEFGSLASLVENQMLDLDIFKKNDIAADVATGMKYLHAQIPPISLRSLQPRWVLLDRRWKAKVLVDNSSLTIMPGTPGFINERDNVYQFAVLLCQLYAGLSTFAGSAEQSQEGQAAPVPPDVMDLVGSMSPLLRNLVEDCLRPDKDMRPTFAMVVDVIQAVMKTTTTRAASAQGTGSGADGSLAPRLASRRSNQVAPLPPSTSATFDISQHSAASRPRSMLMHHHHHHHHHHAKQSVTEDLLYEVFPPKVAEALKAGRDVEPELYNSVSVLFIDMVNYTIICSELQPYEVMDMLDRLYRKFDRLVRDYQLFKGETIGDAYLAVANLIAPQQADHAKRLTEFAFDAIQEANSTLVHPDHPHLGTIDIRVGLHTGPVVASVVGTINRRYCLFGDTVNLASRMESTSEPNKVQCSRAFNTLLKQQWSEVITHSRGIIEVKGKGAMETFFIEAPPIPRNLGNISSDEDDAVEGVGSRSTRNVMGRGHVSFSSKLVSNFRIKGMDMAPGSGLPSRPGSAARHPLLAESAVGSSRSSHDSPSPTPSSPLPAASSRSMNPADSALSRNSDVTSRRTWSESSARTLKTIMSGKPAVDELLLHDEDEGGGPEEPQEGMREVPNLPGTPAGSAEAGASQQQQQQLQKEEGQVQQEVQAQAHAAEGDSALGRDMPKGGGGSTKEEAVLIQGSDTIDL